MYPINLPEEELKSKVAADFFSPNPQSENIKLDKEQKTLLKTLDSTQILGRIDFCISYNAKTLFQPINFLWAEAKKGNKSDIIESFIQLILTIGKEKTYENNLPPLFLGAFDCEKIAFIPYHELDSIFTQNDFNWLVTPSKHDTKEFKQLYALAKELIEKQKLQFSFKSDYKELQSFIQANFTLNNENIAKIPITKNNFTTIYQKWLTSVAPSIGIDWNLAKNAGILDADFYLADLLSAENQSLLDKLFVVLKQTHYEFNKTTTFMGTQQKDTASFNDNQKAHTAFWNLYERPPKEEYWSYIIDRRDLLVPSDIRERKGAFFTPQIWVGKAQNYLAKALGENYQSEYYIWDLAAGTGNLLTNLTESHKLYASTLDKADVEIMQELSNKNALHLLPKHIFQFDFLNDEFFDTICEKHQKEGLNFADEKCEKCQKSKVPKSLQEILKDEAKRKRLIIFINPPYAEAGTTAQTTGTGKNKDGVALGNATYERYKDSMGKASNELFAQFFFRIYKEIPHCHLAAFSTLKYVNSSNFIKFRETFQAKFLKGFIAPAYTFDNVKGNFPIGFLIWNLAQPQAIKNITLDIFNDSGAGLGKKKFYTMQNTTANIGKWIAGYRIKNPPLHLAMLNSGRVDFQNQKLVYIKHYVGDESHALTLTLTNLIPCAVFFAVRHCIPHTWINHNDQFLNPNKKWEKDTEFQNDCLIFMLFHRKNRITCKEGINHFIPFSEKELNAAEALESHFMLEFIQGKIKISNKKKKGQQEFNFQSDELEKTFIPTKPLEFSHEAKEVFKAGKELFKHYHEQAKDETNYNPNAALYDIKAHFQGFNDKGKINSPQKAKDEAYKDKLGELNYALKNLAKKIEVKVYEYEFLLE
ncbi:hypothetical protein V3Y64_000797 [Campylobacter upsaliensis]|uniref:hypothetical protein n=1 Tax=Campylobacter upsaliensis TaxID=28080 RepID=UPI00126AE6A4|nr:hypothetical protein [Campylobacter upsaliensis]EAH6227928.1 hypothetical protein [Campylobacter upsaliensis]EAJ4645774.1 hypothetical protein [Campylobacter upsaliensis]EAK0954861.1 hypothetical protein [Campylobacter upsaliensis]EAK1130688.1 hypothetical protein [Campylobacter upsaliensis]EAK2458473.1 hypothetical protein [Campylobacter upsaliensis]